jgi:Ser/Thr protein kinase RdoA (MazF antagonist)
MSLLQAPRFDAAGAERLARDLYGADVSAALLPSERDQNFLLTTAAGDRFVLKIANGGEDRAMLEAQNAAMAHVAARVAFCPRVVPARSGDAIAMTSDGNHFVRLVTYLAGMPLAKTESRPPALFENLGHAIGQLDAALADFDHPAIHRDFHWDLANAEKVVREHVWLVPGSHRMLVAEVSLAALEALDATRQALRRSAVHHDANDWNVLVSNAGESDGVSIAGIIDFGDMVYSWTVADPAVAAAYSMLDAPDPLASVAAIAAGYQSAYELHDEELAALFPLAALRLCMSACIAAWQQQQRPDDEYLAISQGPIRRTLPAVAAIDLQVAAATVRAAADSAQRR